MNLNTSPSPEPEQIEQEAMALEQKPWYADFLKQTQSLWYGLAGRGPKIASQGLLEILSRSVRGAPISHYSEITANITVSGQYHKHGWKLLAKRGITAVINMRTEWDDQAAGIAPPRYMHLKVIDNTPPTLEMLQAGVDFISEEIANGGKVYIHCAAGVGRAPTMAAAYLISTGMTPDDALNHIRSIRPFIRPTPEQVAQLHSYAEKLKASDAETSAHDITQEMNVSTAPAESTIAIKTEVPIKLIPVLGTGEAVQAGIPEQLAGAAPVLGEDAAPQGTVQAGIPEDTHAKDISQDEGGTKSEQLPAAN